MNSIGKQIGVLVNLEFSKLFVGQLFSHLADAIIQFLLAGILLQISENPGKSVATMFFVFLLPQFLLSLFSGALSDRFSRKVL